MKIIKERYRKSPPQARIVEVRIKKGKQLYRKELDYRHLINVSAFTRATDFVT